MIIVQFIIFLVQFFIFLSSTERNLDFFVINSSAVLTALSFYVSLRHRNKTYLGKYNFSIITFFIIMGWIISFQIPLEISYGNEVLLNYNFIYDVSVVNKMVSFSALMLIAFLLGVSLWYKKTNTYVVETDKSWSKFEAKPVFILLLISFSVFLIFVDRAYISGGHGVIKFEGIAASSLGIFIRLSVIYLSIIFYNNHYDGFKVKKRFVSMFNKTYLLFLIIIIVIFFLAHNRVYVIYTIAPFLFAYFIFSKREFKTITVLTLFVILSIFGTLFKIYGIGNIFSNNLSIDSNYVISKSYFPFTAELANSVYSQSILFNLFNYQDLMLYGSSYFVGLLRTFPGIMGLLNIDPNYYDTAIIATNISGVNYGVGTTIVSDLLINFGGVLSVILIGCIGYFFSKYESLVYKPVVSIYSYVIYFSITSHILFIPRASMNDLLATLLFNLLFIKIYGMVYKR